MLSDRRPILLTNARIIDPSRDLDFLGDLLIAEGVIREAKRGIGAAGVPEGTEIIDCRGQGRRARPDRPARVRRRTRRRVSRDARIGEPGGSCRRRHHNRVPAGHQPGDRRAGDGRLRAAARARHRDRPRPPDGGPDQGPQGRGDDRDRPAQGRRCRRLHGRRAERDQRAGHPARADLRARFRRADRPSHRGSRTWSAKA